MSKSKQDKPIANFSNNGKEQTSIKIQVLSEKITEIVKSWGVNPKVEVSQNKTSYGSLYFPKGKEEAFDSLLGDLVSMITKDKSIDLGVYINSEGKNLFISFHLYSNEDRAFFRDWGRIDQAAKGQGGELRFIAPGTFEGKDHPIIALTMPGFQDNAISEKQPVVDGQPT